MKHFTCLRVTPVLLALFLCAILPASRAATYYVATSGSDAAAGTNWATAKVTIQAAVNLTTNGDLVLVSNGVYSTGATLPSGLTISNRVMITNQIILQSANGPAVTQITGSYASGASPANVRCLLFDCPTGMISGFTLYSGGTLETSNSTSSTFNNDGGGVWAGRGVVITNCVISTSAGYNGGGVYGGILNNCSISNCSGYYGGGAYGSTVTGCFLFNNGSTKGGGACVSTLTNCTLQACHALYGGGAAYSTLYGCTLQGDGRSVVNVILCTSGGATYECKDWNCTMTGNGSMTGGGASYLDTLYNCQLISNTTSGNVILEGGGGAWQSKLLNCLLSGNVANGTGGGGAYNCYLTNCWVMGNTASSGGGLYSVSAYSCTVWNNTSTGDDGGGVETAAVYNSIVYGNHGTSPTDGNNGGIGGGYDCIIPSSGTTGSITNDPQFVSTATGDLHLTASSPCIDAGNNAYVANTTDYDGNPRIIHGTVDMGASEFQGYWAWAAAITNSQTNITDSATGDGYPNLLKYVTGSSPTNSDNLAQLSESLGTNNVFSVAFNHNTNANDVTIYVEQNGSLNSGSPWTDIATNIDGTWVASTNETETGASSPSIVTVSDSAPVSTNGFFRLRVTKP